MSAGTRGRKAGGIRLLSVLLALVFAWAGCAAPADPARAAETAAVETAEGYPYTTTTFEAVNLRGSASAHGNILLVIPAGATVTVLKTVDGWAVVEYGGAVGYVKNEYIALRIPGGTVWWGAGETDTKLVQQRLKDLGYYQGAADGTFGEQTAAALRAFQAAAGIQADGVGGENTIKMLFSRAAPAASPSVAEAEETSVFLTAGANACGNSLTWSISADKKTLTISGTGNMYEYPEHLTPGGALSQPWMIYKNTITDIRIAEGVTSVGSGAFWGCEALREITLPSSIRSIGFAAFAECYALRKAVIPSGMIGESAFIRCTGLKEVTIGSGVSAMGISAFESCSALDAVFISDVAAWCRIYFGGNKASPMEYAGNLYLNGSLVRNLTIPGSVGRISDYAFEHCKAITSLTVQEGVTAIGEYAFNGCSALSSVYLPNSLTSVDAFAFASCAQARISLPAGISSIGERAFDGCRLEGTVAVHQGRIGECAFRACGNIVYLEIGANVTWIGENAFADMGALRGVHYGGTEADWNRLSAKANLTSHRTNPYWEGNTYGSAQAAIEAEPAEVTFGGYPWIVLTTSGDQSLLITRDVIRFMNYWKLRTFNDAGLKVTWASSPIREWLNGSFLSSFSESDRAAIRATSVSTPSNARFGTADGSSTTDKVFLLSAEEANAYFRTDELRAAKGSAAALNEYGDGEGRRDPTTGNTYWWLRTPGMFKYDAAYVNYTGTVRYDGIEATQPAICGVRPAIWVANTAVSLPDTPTPPDPAGAESFVRRLYNVCLDREPDAAGLADWVSQLTSGRNNGSRVAYGFIFSQEFKDKNYCNEHYATYLYRAFLGREPDQPGLRYWEGLLDQGTTREEIFNGFIGSIEFTNLCEEYHITRGDGIEVPAPGYGTAPIGFCSECHAESGIHKFVTRLYDVCLNRLPDEAGLLDWSVRLRDHAVSGTAAAYGFVFSAEFTNKNYNNDTFIEYLYQAFMGRASDPVGKQNWLAQMQSGWSREKVFQGFAGSVEFGMICAAYGIARD
ncbi:MAG: DUF4214 domain-containing protein [Clostridia bacterium]|nr:DUF4214 domain-containing protein [Clostridia bacterium]